MSESLDIYLQKFNRMRKIGIVFSRLINGLRFVLLLSFALMICAWMNQDSLWLQATLLVAAVGVLFFYLPGKKVPPLSASDLATALDIKYADKKNSPYEMTRGDAAEISGWLPELEQLYQEGLSSEGRYLGRLATSLILPILALVSVMSFVPDALPATLSQVNSIVAKLSHGAELKVLEGVSKVKDMEKTYKLSPSSNLKLELQEDNMLQVKLVGEVDPKVPYQIWLKRPDVKKTEQDKTTNNEPMEFEEEDPIYQRFQLERSVDDNSGAIATYRLAFSVNQTSELIIPSLSDSKPVALVVVKGLPLPKVWLAADTELGEDVWPDDKPLPLRIKVKGEAPLDKVSLAISSGGHTSRELVYNIVAADKLNVETEYTLILEPYLHNDLAEVEIVAEAIDRSVPVPLVGRSRPLVIKVASAYGRYRQTLGILRGLKVLLDEAVAEQHKEMPAKAGEIMSKVVSQAEESPFFDAIDRMTLRNFDTGVKQLTQKFSAGQTMQLSSDINRFLFEHEMLDDKERDRDFFVSVRGLSRLIEQKPEERPVPVSVVSERMKKYLDERYQRWEARVGRLGEKYTPKEWDEVQKLRPFHKGLTQIGRDEASGADPQKSLVTLSKVASKYRKWIESLEKAEDKQRSEQEKKRQKGIASARNQLRELQKRQSKISKSLQRADLREKEELESNWPVTKMQQSTNIKGTGKLENQLRSLSPSAGERLKFASEAMELAVQEGSKGNFSNAESGSDLAARLLHEADSAAQKSQRQGSERRRRRVTGDGYYGQSIVGGDVEIRTEYKVDKRYRENILKEVRGVLGRQDGELDPEDRRLLDSYLREVVR